jgi:hypothetical protein
MTKVTRVLFIVVYSWFKREMARLTIRASQYSIDEWKGQESASASRRGREKMTVTCNVMVI